MNNHLVTSNRTSTLSGQVVHVGGDASFTSRAERYAQQHCAGLLWYGRGGYVPFKWFARKRETELHLKMGYG